MAEVVAATAAVVQFLDVALRLSSCLERFCSDVRNVPRRFLQLQTDLRQQIEIAQRIQNDHVPSFATTVSPSALDLPLVEYISLAEELNKALEELLARKNDGVLQRGWSGFCSSRKKEEVAHICDRLEQKRSVLSMWLNAANLKLSSETVAATDQIRIEIGQTLTLVKTVDKTSTTAELNTARLLPHVQQIDRNVSTASERTERIIQDLQHLKSQSRSFLVDRDVNATAQESSRQTTAMVLSNTEQILRAIEKLSSDFDRASVGTRDGFAVGKQRVDSSDTRTQRSAMDRTSKPRRCRCRTVGTARRWQPLSILRFTRTFRAQHFSYCPDYRISEQSLEITMQLVPPIWLFSHTVNLSTHVKNWSTMGPFSISPIVVGTSRLVDPMASPAFRAIERISKEIREIEEVGQLPTSITRLQNKLQDLFDAKEASVLDVDNDGNTVLNKVLSLFIVGPWFVSSKPHECIAIIRFLLERGADPNVLRSSDDGPSFRFGYPVTVCDQLAISVVHLIRLWGLGKLSSAMISPFLEVHEHIVEAGGHLSRPSPQTYPREPGYFRHEIEHLLVFEDQIDVRDLGDLVPMILRRQVEQFQRLVHKSKLLTLEHASSFDGLTPIHFAVFWPTGLRMLLERGVRVDPEDIGGRRPIHLAVAFGISESVRCLLDEDCGLSTPPGHDSLLQLALRLQDPKKSQVLRLLVPALIDRHKRLQDMASKLLPPSVFSQLNLTFGHLHEQIAPLIVETLISHGIDVPRALELDGKSFYNVADYHGDSKLAPEIARAFWEAGFRDIDVPNKNGVTPFLQSWFHANFEMVDWFTQRGISMSSRHELASLTALHFYARRLRDTGFNSADKVDAVPTNEHYMDLVQKELEIPYDDCRCACSPRGCAPIKFLFNKSYEVDCRKPRIRRWFENVRPSQPLKRQYVYDITRYLLFDFLNGEHTCCSLGRDCSIKRAVSREKLPKNRSMKRVHGRMRRSDEHCRFCMNGIPIPQLDCLHTLGDPEVLETTLDSAMSHFDEMDRPDTMPVEEQVLEYINWLLAEGHLDIDVSYECEHKLGRYFPCSDYT